MKPLNHVKYLLLTVLASTTFNANASVWGWFGNSAGDDGNPNTNGNGAYTKPNTSAPVRLSATSQANTTPNNSTTPAVKSIYKVNWVSLGAPMYDATKTPISPTLCVDTSAARTSTGLSPEMQSGLNKAANKSSIDGLLDLGFGIEGLNIFGIGIDVKSLSFSAQIIDNQYSHNLTYYQAYATDSKILTTFGDSNLNDSGRSALAAGNDQFFKTCGDSFISAMKAGSVLIINVKLHSTDKELIAKLKGDTTINLGDFNLGKLLPSINSSHYKQSSNKLQLEVSAIQKGGTPEKLAAILGGDGNLSTSCDLGNIEPCQKAINSLINYASTLGTQIKDQNGTLIQNNLYYYNPVISSYSSVGINVPEPKPLSSKVLSAQNKLIEAVNKYKNQITFLDHYNKDTTMTKSSDVQSFVPEQITKLQARLDYIAANGEVCFNAKADKCPDFVQQTIQMFNEIPSRYGFDAANYNLLSHAWQYSIGNSYYFLIPTSFGGIYRVKSDNVKSANNLNANVEYTQEGNAEYASKIVIPNANFWNVATSDTCLPAGNDNKLSKTRSFTCKDLSDYQVTFRYVDNPL